MKVLSIIGTRPQYVKLGALINSQAAHELTHDWIDTGQHYTAGMSENFIEEFNLPNPKLNLKVGSGSHGSQLSKMIEGIESFLMVNSYDVVIVYGDTNSTLAAALVASKLGIPVAHVEAGLRSGNMSMPEEQNRRIVDHISSVLYAPTDTAVSNLQKEGLTSVVNSGDVMLDILMKNSSLHGGARRENTDFALATIHRAENTDSENRLRAIILALENLSITVILPAHPRLLQRIHEFKVRVKHEKIRLVEPLSHRELIEKVMEAKCVITDSGGLQKEAFMLKKLCITIREETEWPETLKNDWNILNPKLENLDYLIARPNPLFQNSYFGNGHASDFILHDLKNRYGSTGISKRKAN